MPTPTYRYWIDNSLTGAHLAEVNLTNVRYSYGLNGSGGATASMSMLDPKCTPTLMQTLSRDLTILRDGVVVFNGPITGLRANSDDNSLAITASPVWWWLSQRTVELNQNYTGIDLAVVVKGIIDTSIGKFSGDIRLLYNAGYPATIGQTVSRVFDASARPTVADVVSDLSQGYPGFDWDIGLTLNGSGIVERRFQIYAGFKGSLKDQALTQSNLSSFTQTDDGTRVYNRVHELGAVVNETQYLVSQSNYRPIAFSYTGGTLPTFDDQSSVPGTDNNSGAPVAIARNTAKGNPRDSISIGTGGSYAFKSVTAWGVGSTLDFDFYVETASGKKLTNYEVPLFGIAVNSGTSGTGLYFSPRIDYNYARTTFRCGLVYQSGIGTSPPVANQYISNAAPLTENMWHHVTVQILSSSTCAVWVNGQRLLCKNAGSTATDSITFPYTPSTGTVIGPAASNYGGMTKEWTRGYYDNIYVTAGDSSLSAQSIPYVERVVNRSDVTDLSQLRLYAQADLYLGAWPSLTYEARFQPSAALPFGFVTPGDTVPVKYTPTQGGGWLTVNSTKRVIMLSVDVDEALNEQVTITFNDTHA